MWVNEIRDEPDMSFEGIFSDGHGKFHIGDELVVCYGTLDFAQLIEKHMGVEARDYFIALVREIQYECEGGDEGE